MKPKCSKNGHCHHAPVTSFWAWFCAVVHISLAHIPFVTWRVWYLWPIPPVGNQIVLALLFRMCAAHLMSACCEALCETCVWEVMRKRKGLSLLMQVSKQTYIMLYGLWLKKFKILVFFSHTPIVSLQKTFDSSTRVVWITTCLICVVFEVLTLMVQSHRDGYIF